ncbi:MAG: aminotransferase class I/II-fold pyridoxal phosphate-dependent enzyme [Cohaesibacter sp.]|nr:aminotransferase class I/II-fold pyridoxal phosphate-dependent enzyme [Cohaesibacter sp.]
MIETSSLATLLAQVMDDPHGAVNPPIVQSSLFAFDDYNAFEARMAGQTDEALYTRVQNPTVAAFENLMAQAEKGEAAVGFASGMAAISSTILAFIKAGDRIACVEHVYPDTYRLMERLLRPFGVEIDYYPVDAFANEPDLLKDVQLAYLESPTSMVMATTDLARVAAHARRHGVLTMIDNSWASPVFQNPLSFGIDIVLHSASKYISGHSDTVAGVVVSSQAYIARIRDLTLPLLGGKLAPFEAFLLIRGLRSLSARMRQHEETAELFIKRLKAHPLVSNIHAPELDSSPGLMGRAGLISVELSDHVDIPAFSDALKLFRLGVSWGGFESLVIPARIALAQAGDENSVQRFGVSPNLVRINLGLEDREDLWADFEQALTLGGNKR